MEIVALLSHYGFSAYSKSDISHLLSEKRAGSGNRTRVTSFAKQDAMFENKGHKMALVADDGVR